MKKIVFFVFLVCIFVWAGVREDRAEENARKFCDSAIVGDSFTELQRRAKSAGEDKLRFIREESVTIGFTGIPPFSRHVCEIRSKESVISEKQYFYID